MRSNAGKHTFELSNDAQRLLDKISNKLDQSIINYERLELLQRLTEDIAAREEKRPSQNFQSIEYYLEELLQLIQFQTDIDQLSGRTPYHNIENIDPENLKELINRVIGHDGLRCQWPRNIIIELPKDRADNGISISQLLAPTTPIYEELKKIIQEIDSGRTKRGAGR